METMQKWPACQTVEERQRFRAAKQPAFRLERHQGSRGYARFVAVKGPQDRAIKERREIKLHEIEFGTVLQWANIWDFHQLDYAYKTFGRIFVCGDGRVIAWGDEKK